MQRRRTWYARLASILIGAILALTGLSVAPALATGAVCYVNGSASGSNNGASWNDAYTDLQSALANSSCTEIWVASGTYYPTSGADRTATFQLRSGVALYGGFSGSETSRDQRNADPATNNTVLSGDIGTPDDNSDNSYHVVTGSGTDSTAVLDGFTITQGKASGTGSDTKGGGMVNDDGSPTVTNDIFSQNVAGNSSGAGNGGGMWNTNGSNPTISRVTFSGNHTNNTGGGMYNQNSDPTLTDVTFTGNHAGTQGGGLGDVASSPTLLRVTFDNNGTPNFGGAMYNQNSNPSLTNVTFSNNIGSYGGAIYNLTSSPTLTNVTFAGNTARKSGRAIFDQYQCAPVLTNVVMWDVTTGSSHEFGSYQSTPTISYSDIQGSGGSGASWNTAMGTDGGHNLDADPLLGSLADNGGFTQTIALDPASPAVDAGNNASCPATDQRGISRPQGAACDMGSYEVYVNHPPVADPGGPYLGKINTPIHFDGSGSSDPDGNSITYSWDFGIEGSGSGVAPIESFAEVGIHTVCLTVNDGMVDSVPVCTQVVIYDPSAGFVTGGGWFDSPEGADVSTPDLTGKASFTMEAKYVGSSSSPLGHVGFRLNAGHDSGFHFTSTHLAWLIVTQQKSMALIHGDGLIDGHLAPNGQPYQFTVTATDGTPDSFQIRVWWTDATGVDQVVYDNGAGQAIGAGNISIHHPANHGVSQIVNNLLQFALNPFEIQGS